MTINPPGRNATQNLSLVTVLGLVSLVSYGGLAIKYKSLNPEEIARKSKQEHKRTERYHEQLAPYNNHIDSLIGLTKELLDKPGYVDRNHDKRISLEEELELRQKAGIDSSIPLDEAVAYSVEELQRAVKAYEAEAAGK